MNAWKRVKLGEVTKLVRGKYVTRDSVKPGPVPVILGGKEPAYYCDESNHEGPCFVISRSGASAGFVTFWDEPIFVTDGFLFEAKPGADIRYLYYCLKSQQRSLAEMQNGAGIPHVRAEDLKQRLIPLPPLPTQRRIADILSAYDDKIANNRRRMELLEETARLLYRKMTSGQLPNGTITDICREERNGVRPSDIDPKTPYIGLEHMPRRSISLCDWGNAQKVTSAKLIFKAGDILFGKIRPYFHKVGMAFVDGVASSDAVVIKPLREEFRPFVLLTVSGDAFVAAASQGMKEGSKMPRADWKQLLKYAIWIPDDNLLDGFNVQINPILNELKTLCLQNHLLAEARDMLLPRLID